MKAILIKSGVSKKDNKLVTNVLINEINVVNHVLRFVVYVQIPIFCQEYYQECSAKCLCILNICQCTSTVFSKRGA